MRAVWPRAAPSAWRCAAAGFGRQTVALGGYVTRKPPRSGAPLTPRNGRPTAPAALCSFRAERTVYDSLWQSAGDDAHALRARSPIDPWIDLASGAGPPRRTRTQEAATFSAAAGNIGRNIHTVARKLAELARLVRQQRVVFDPAPGKITARAGSFRSRATLGADEAGGTAAATATAALAAELRWCPVANACRRPQTTMLMNGSRPISHRGSDHRVHRARVSE